MEIDFYHRHLFSYCLSKACKIWHNFSEQPGAGGERDEADSRQTGGDLRAREDLPEETPRGGGETALLHHQTSRGWHYHV